MRPRRQATCHPERPHYGRDLCKQCYQKDRWDNNPKHRVAILRKMKAWYHKPENKARRQAHSKAWYGKNKKRVQLHNIEKKYGLTPDAYREMYDAQSGFCGICKQSPIECVDHCHKTGKVRGLLCSRCNLCLGHYEELANKGLLEAVVEFLR